MVIDYVDLLENLEIRLDPVLRKTMRPARRREAYSLLTLRTYRAIYGEVPLELAEIAVKYVAGGLKVLKKPAQKK